MTKKHPDFTEAKKKKIWGGHGSSRGEPVAPASYRGMCPITLPGTHVQSQYVHLFKSFMISSASPFSNWFHQKDQ